MSSVNIILDKTTYIAGENITGRVEIANTTSKKIRHISLRIKGSADVRWSETESYTENGEQKSRSITYSSHEQYLDSVTVLYGQVDGPTIQLLPGNHTYSFVCSLPRELPGSISDVHGNIVYMAEVKFDVAWAFDDKYNKYFQVVPYLDLNEDPSLRLASQIERVKTYCAWNCSSSPAVILVTIPKSGFVIDEDIPISVHISNKSHVEIQTIKAKLVKAVVCISHTPRRKAKEEYTKILDKDYNLGEKGFDKEIDLNMKLRVPHIPTTCKLSSIVRLHYHVEVSIFVSGCHSTCRINMPVTIGTFPIRFIGDTNTVLPQMNAFHAPIAPVAPPMVPQMEMPKPIVPPPLPGSSPAPTAPYPPAMPSSAPTAPTDPSLDEAAPPPSYSEVVYGWKSDGKT